MGWYDLPPGYGLAKMAEGLSGGMATGTKDTAIFNQRQDIADRELNMRQQGLDIEQAKFDFMKTEGVSQKEAELVFGTMAKVGEAMKAGMLPVAKQLWNSLAVEAQRRGKKMPMWTGERTSNEGFAEVSFSDGTSQRFPYGEKSRPMEVSGGVWDPGTKGWQVPPPPKEVGGEIYSFAGQPPAPGGGSALDRMGGGPGPGQRTPLSPEEETVFRDWYGGIARQGGLNPDPDAPGHFYDYRAAWKSGAGPDQSGHWPSAFKQEGHPNMVIDGVNTKTGEPAGGGAVADLGSASKMLGGWQKTGTKKQKESWTDWGEGQKRNLDTGEVVKVPVKPDKPAGGGAGDGMAKVGNINLVDKLWNERWFDLAKKNAASGGAAGKKALDGLQILLGQENEFGGSVVGARLRDALNETQRGNYDWGKMRAQELASTYPPAVAVNKALEEIAARSGTVRKPAAAAAGGKRPLPTF